jgi:hypothetical protein
VVSAAACAGATPPGATASDPTKPGASAGGATAPRASGTASPAPEERPFAASGAQATQLIGDVLDKRQVEMNKCISEYRARKNLPHERVEVSVGIDQNGRLIGASLKKAPGKPDPDAPLTECFQKVLSTAPFPRSHAGIITMTKSYEDIVQ